MLAGDVQLQQIPTVWNVSDLCTKAFNQQRVKLLLHELNVCDDGGLTVIGQEEHDQQSERHGSKRQMMKLAKNLMRIFVLMGLGRTMFFKRVGSCRDTRTFRSVVAILASSYDLTRWLYLLSAMYATWQASSTH